MKENEITDLIINSAIKIHRRLGPGLLESVYETILAYEIQKHGLTVERQKAMPLIYDGLIFPDPFRADLVVNGSVLVELKSVEQLQPVHSKQLLTYLRISGAKLGLLVNFNSSLLKDGLRRVINGLEDPS